MDSKEIKEKIKRFNKRWGIVDDSSYEEEFEKFRTRIFNIMQNIDNHVTKEGILTFCQILGIKETWRTRGIYSSYYSTNIIDALYREKDEKRFYQLLEIVFLLPIQTTIDYDTMHRYNKEILYREVANAIELSNINLAITAKDGEVILYPRGEEALDEKLVDEVLSFLNENSQEHFVKALRFYQKGTNKDFIESAESLRRALEEFLRFKLNNNKGLDKNILGLQKVLKGYKCDPNLRKIIFQIFSYLDQYFNENSKHKDGDINEPENEFLIYQTGLLIRYIHKVLK